MTLTPGGNPQWLPADGRYVSGYATAKPPFPERPHTGVSRGNIRDLHRNSRGFARTRGIGGWMIGLCYDPSATYFQSIADDSSETTIPNAPTHQKPPAGVK